MSTQENVAELAAIAQEIGATTLQGHLRYTLERNGWHIGGTNLEKLLESYRDRPMLTNVKRDATR